MACVPFILLFYFVGIPVIYAFSITNVLVLVSALWVVFKCLYAEQSKKLLLILILSINPIIFYFAWPSAEVFIYSFIVVSMVFWHNREYRKAAFAIGIAGSLNPVIMAIGIVMSIEYAWRLYFQCSKNINYKISELIKYSVFYICGIIPLVYFFYHTGHINLPAGTPWVTTYGNETVINRVCAYIFDLNLGILPYYPFILLLASICIFSAIKKKYYGYIVWIVTFLVVCSLYSTVIHINCGMSGIARYNAWNSVILIFAVVLHYDKIYDSIMIQKLIKYLILAGIALVALIIHRYGIYAAPHALHNEFTPIAKYTLDKFPDFYNPLPSIFNIRSTHIDFGYKYETPLMYHNDYGVLKKIYASKKDIEEIMTNNISLSGYDEDFKNYLIANLEDEPKYLSPPEIFDIEDSNQINNYELGQTIYFTERNYNANAFCIKGIYYPEKWGSWLKRHAYFRLKVDKNIQKIRARIEVGYVLGKQEVIIHVNNALVYSDNFVESDFYTHTRIIEFDIPITENTKVVDISFDFPKATTPKKLGINNDERVLGLGIKTMRFDEVE